ncbi:hypothetical protein EVAR_80039_1 [Eumeta japonica]|uniref:Uncharacterized protein n=1 Tax=Eumeta variegata TaxID=151549 RepID=A0A4C1WPD1_EUMVA|nr:hypothetical protein EVAR_80039_1 [Eumeta japonica]
MLISIWRSGIDWVETIKVDEHKKWLKWVNEIRKLASIEILRCISPGHTEEEIHVFVDASERSYAAAMYWRVKLSEHKNAVSLMVGKARVAPLKIILISRLELQAALLGARLDSLILNEIKLNVYERVPTHYDAPSGARRPYMSCAGRGRHRARYSWHRAKMKKNTGGGCRPLCSCPRTERSPREEVLHSLLLEAEHIVNSRPLTEVDIEPTEAEGLRPDYSLIRRFCGAAAAGHFDNNVLLGPTNWRACKRLADHLKEHLPTLVPRRACGDPICRAPAEGDIVLIVYPLSP